MTIARRRRDNIDAISAPMPDAVPSRPPVPEIDAPVPLGDAPAPEAATPVGRMRRCTFRRIDSVEELPGRPAVSTYEVMCLYGDREAPMALGDLDAAQRICEACTASGIFRPDED